MAGVELPLAAIQEQIRRAIDVIVHQERAPDGRRVITAVKRMRDGRDGYELDDLPV